MSMSLDELIAVLQAAKDGKTIECRSRRSDEQWEVKANALFWDSEHYEYRVKPEPREWWVNVSANGRARLMVAFETEQAAEESAAGDSSFETIHVREVLE